LYVEKCIVRQRAKNIFVLKRLRIRNARQRKFRRTTAQKINTSGSLLSNQLQISLTRYMPPQISVPLAKGGTWKTIMHNN
jgi:hypothetical protein